jgi:uncharacterized protein involved in exopolysaccharide biosynthesis
MDPLVRLTATALRFRALTLGIPTIAVILTAVLTLAGSRTYTSTSSFVPQGQDASISRLAGLAAQFGVAVPGQNAAQSGEFYADLVTARSILGPVVTDTIEGARSDDGSPVRLGDLLRARGKDSTAWREDAIRKLRSRLSVTADLKTSVVTLGVRTRWPEVSQRVAGRVVEAIIDFDLHTRQSRASAERKFTEARLAQARIELRDAEDALQNFLDRNRQYRESPSLQLQFDRLTREVTSRQQVLDAVRQAYEQARIEEVRNTPRVTVIEPANLPARPNSRRFVLRVMLAGAAGLLLGLGSALIAQGLTRSRATGDGQIEQVGDLWRSFLRDLRAPWRLFRNPG